MMMLVLRMGMGSVLCRRRRHRRVSSRSLNNRIHDTSATSEGDALRLDGWHDVMVTGNDIYDIRECPGNSCHTDTLQSYNGGVPTSGLTLTDNYTHDNVGAQGLPFLKDGDISQRVDQREPVAA